jgi:DNA-binding NarL/FixJ family response regulator
LACETSAVTTRVLIVDDHAGFRAQARKLLESHGYEVVGEAADGAEAAATVGALQPEVVLLDVHLPDGNGFEIVEHLVELGCGARVVMMSGHDAKTNRARLSRAPGLPFIFKPDLSSETLQESMRAGPAR